MPKEKNKNAGMPGVMLYADLRAAAALLSLEERGLLLDAILAYGLDGEAPEFESPGLQLIWTFVAPRIDSDREKYREKCDRARQNSRKRWPEAREEDADQNEKMPVDASRNEKMPVDAKYNSTSTSTSTSTSNSISTSTSTSNSTGRKAGK